MGNFTGTTRETRGGYTIWINGEAVTTAKNPTEAAAKLEKEVNRHAVNAAREAVTSIWKSERAEVAYNDAERAGLVLA